MAYPVCDYRHPYDVDAFDLMRHNGYLLTIFIVLWMNEEQREARYEKNVIFLKFIFFWGTLVNCFLFNLEGDRDFHWYSIPIVLLSVGGGIRKAYPELHSKLTDKIPLYKYFFFK